MSKATTRVAIAASIAVLIGTALLALAQLRAPGWWFQDSEAYWSAAQRLRDGQPLYPILSSQDASAVYRYAPWFAVAWVPLTYLPKAAVLLAWTAAMMVAAGYCVRQTAAARSVAGYMLALIALALLVPAAATGNVQPGLVALLLWGVERRSGPFWIAAAASLKAAPILLVSVYLGRGQWIRAAAVVVLSAVLVGPILWFDLAHYPTDVAAAAGPLPSWASWGAAGILTLSAAATARTRYGWLVAAAGVIFAIPRWSYYQPSMVLVGLAPPEPGRSPEPPAARRWLP